MAMLIAGLAFGQSTDSTLKFEAADIHPAPAAAPGTNNQNMRSGLYRGGLYEVCSATMLDLVRTAYNVDVDQVTGGPPWMEKDRFDITAKARGDSTPEKIRVMLRNLLVGRFSLVVHSDTKPLAAYAIRQGKKTCCGQDGIEGWLGFRYQILGEYGLGAGSDGCLAGSHHHIRGL